MRVGENGALFSGFPATRACAHLWNESDNDASDDDACSNVVVRPILGAETKSGDEHGQRDSRLHEQHDEATLSLELRERQRLHSASERVQSAHHCPDVLGDSQSLGLDYIRTEACHGDHVAESYREEAERCNEIGKEGEVLRVIFDEMPQRSSDQRTQREMRYR